MHTEVDHRRPPSSHGPSCTCRQDEKSSCRARPRRESSASSSSIALPGRYSSGAYFASACVAMIRRVKRMPSTATRRSSSVLQIVQLDFRKVGRLRAFNAHPTARARTQITDARRDRREAVQRIAELVQRQWLHVPFDVRCRLRRIALGERAELRRRHRQRPGAKSEILERPSIALPNHAIRDAR